MSILHVDSVTKSYDQRAILTDVFISCAPGEIVGLVGRNGCGKSTLLKIIFGTLSAGYKFVKVGDKRIKGLFDGRKLIKYLPQEDFLPASLKVERIIALFCGVQASERLSRNELIEPLLGKRVRELSGGQLRVLEIMLIVSSEGRFILLDEPFKGVSPLHVKEIKRVIREESQDKGFIITDHSFADISDIATRIVMIFDGGTKPVHGEDELRYWGYLPGGILR